MPDITLNFLFSRLVRTHYCKKTFRNPPSSALFDITPVECWEGGNLELIVLSILHWYTNLRQYYFPRSVIQNFKPLVRSSKSKLPIPSSPVNPITGRLIIVVAHWASVLSSIIMIPYHTLPNFPGHPALCSVSLYLCCCLLFLLLLLLLCLLFTWFVPLGTYISDVKWGIAPWFPASVDLSSVVATRTSWWDSDGQPVCACDMPVSDMSTHRFIHSGVLGRYSAPY